LRRDVKEEGRQAGRVVSLDTIKRRIEKQIRRQKRNEQKSSLSTSRNSSSLSRKDSARTQIINDLELARQKHLEFKIIDSLIYINFIKEYTKGVRDEMQHHLRQLKEYIK
jgi:hypothetical protein